MFANIEEGTERIRRIVEELRDYARDEPVDRKDPVDLNRVVMSALSLLKNLIKHSTRAFYVTYGKNLPLFRGDYRRVEQVIINLVQNACQAFENEPGEISIITSCDPSREELVFQVNDTGCGIPPENLRRLRDPFFTTKRRLGGTGLGLSICDTITSRHGGRLEFSSETGQGTTVRMILPTVNHPHHRPAAATQEESHAG
jgi:polar amino acid transport system substrate-binding protein